jgi:hypothetical protein
VYNYLFNQWTTFTNLPCIRACSWQGKLVILKTDSEMFLQSSKFSDNNAHIPMVIETSWLSFAGIAGFQRLYAFQLLGEYISKHIVKVSLSYNFSEVVREELTRDVTSDFESDNFGDVPFYGAGSFGDASDNTYSYNNLLNVYQYQIRPMIQKCQSVKIKIEDMPTQDNVIGEAMSLNSITCLIGGKKGMMKVSNSNKIGA